MKREGVRRRATEMKRKERAKEEDKRSTESEREGRKAWDK